MRVDLNHLLKHSLIDFITLPPPSCEEAQPVRFDGTRDPRWVEAHIGPTITYALEPCDYGPDPNAPTYTGPPYESWTDREYVYGSNDVERFS